MTEALVATPAGRQLFHFPFAEEHNLDQRAGGDRGRGRAGAPLGEMADGAANIGFSRFRGERLELGDGIVLVNDCYNANPVSMRAALDHLAHPRRGAPDRRPGRDGRARPEAPPATTARSARTPARPGSTSWSASASRPASTTPTSWSATPEEAAELLAAQLEPGDAILVKGSRSAGLEASPRPSEELIDG